MAHAFGISSSQVGSDVMKGPSHLYSTEPAHQPTVRLWLVGNPVSGHGKGKEQLTALRAAIQKKLRTCCSTSGSFHPGNVHAPLWYASDFLHAAKFDNVELGSNLNTLFNEEFHLAHSTKHEKRRSNIHGDSAPGMPPVHPVNVPYVESMDSFSFSPSPERSPEPQKDGIDDAWNSSVSMSTGSLTKFSSQVPSALPQSCSTMSTSGVHTRGATSRGRSGDLPNFDGPCIQALVIYTEAINDGHRLFERITDMVVHDQLRSLELHQHRQFVEIEKGSYSQSEAGISDTVDTRRGNNEDEPTPSLSASSYVYPYVDIMAMVGGDGTLSEGINGVCHGVLSAYKNWFESVNATVKQMEDMHHPRYELMSKILDSIRLQMEGPGWKTSRRDNVMVEQHMIRRLAPHVLYSPSGTGADFAKLGICCPRVSKFVEIVQGVAGSFYHSYMDHFFHGSFCNNSIFMKASMTSVESRFIHRGSSSGITVRNTKSHSNRGIYDGSYAATSVDVGRISFPKTGRVKYFINECSTGMSVEVIMRTNRFRQKALLAALGGTVIFGSSSFISLVKMAPGWIRMMRLPPRGDPTCPCCDFYLDDAEPPSAQSGGGHSSNFGNKSSSGSSTGGRRINPLYVHETSMEPTLEKVGKDIMREGPSKSDSDHSTTGESVAAVVSEGGVEHIICVNSVDVREELDLVEASVIDDDTPISPVRNRQESFEPLSLCNTEIYTGDDDNKDEETDPNAKEEGNSCRKASKRTALLSRQIARWAYLFSSTVAFGNGRWYGGGMKVTPHGDPTDHLLSVTNWVTSFWTFVIGMFDLYNGDHHAWESTSTFDGARYILDAGPRKRVEEEENSKKESSSLRLGRRKRKDAERDDKEDIERGACTMLLEADGELLEALPAIIEIGAYITMLSPASRGEIKKGTRLRLGKPVPGTRRFALQQEKGATIDENSVSMALDSETVGMASENYRRAASGGERGNLSLSTTGSFTSTESDVENVHFLGAVGRCMHHVSSDVLTAVRTVMSPLPAEDETVEMPKTISEKERKDGNDEKKTSSTEYQGERERTAEQNDATQMPEPASMLGGLSRRVQNFGNGMVEKVRKGAAKLSTPIRKK